MYSLEATDKGMERKQNQKISEEDTWQESCYC